MGDFKFIVLTHSCIYK